MRFVLMGAALAVSMLLCHPAAAATGTVKKVLPLFVDEQGRVALSPSLYARDAYQVILRDDPSKRAGLKFAVNWKSKGPHFSPLTLRVQMRGISEGSLPREKTLETTVKPVRSATWTDLLLTGEQYDRLGVVTAWRVSLWAGDELLSEEKSFLW